MISIKQQFIHFLKDNNVYEEFMYNFEHKKIDRTSFRQYINFTHSFDYIFRSFPWHKTKGGIKLWRTLSNQWIEKLQVPQLFIQFLQDNKLYNEYVTNIIENSKKYYWASVNIFSIEDVFYNYQPIDYINIYVSTLHDIQEKIKWENINKKWKTLLKTIL